ncbi:DUF1028 domain-containing protein [Histidinibacterium aquaticum]|uniref:DUF1028 domain-containing protein n=1 Tax=Histidinibacterium aquaticum TaxID=2613962 RepID=A0A5J5GI22_9RHOB|nr:DUF1028 domain-containing protein [Histidinibacterium aquaticum]KAA9007805.1 DUF1028 domain-containing protein [Histidinibacterium aquaticum]
MTFSILVQDAETGAIGGAAATGSLCVGGWVLRGRLGAGMSASQGAAPSTFWGEEVLDEMEGGLDAGGAVAKVTQADPGRDWRQLSALDTTGRGAAFTGAHNTERMASHGFDSGIAAGNMLARDEVVTELAAGYSGADGALSDRLLTALRAAEAAGSDSRGLLSAALLVLHPDHPPLTLRVDFHESDPIGALAELHRRATTGDYADWARQVPVANDRRRILD